MRRLERDGGGRGWETGCGGHGFVREVVVVVVLEVVEGWMDG